MRTDCHIHIGLTVQLQAQAAPNRLVLRMPKRTVSLTYEDYTFAQLEAEIGVIQAFLLKKGIIKDRRVVLALRPGLRLMATLFALFRIGAIPVLIDPGFKLAHIRQVMRQTQPTAIICERALAAFAFIGRYFLDSIETYICYPPYWHSMSHPMSCVPSHLDDLAAIIFTSGSTGIPKGVHYTHRMFHAQLQLLQSVYKLGAGDIDYPLLQAFCFFNPALGITTVWPEVRTRQPLKSHMPFLWEGLTVSGATQSFGSPILWQKIVSSSQQQTCHSLKKIFMAGCSTPPGLITQLKQSFPQAQIYVPYGATEGLPLTHLDGDDLEQIQSQVGYAGYCLGQPMPGVYLRIEPVEASMVVEHNGQLCTTGEIAVAGDIVSPAYDNLEAINQKTKYIDAEGYKWHRTGDMGYRDDKGILWFLGRCVECVKTKKGWLYPEPIESIFLRHPWVQRAALIGLGQEAIQDPTVVVVLKQSYAKKRQEAVQALKDLSLQHTCTQDISTILIDEYFPVDRRHNAKIHRLKLGKKWTQRLCSYRITT